MRSPNRGSTYYRENTVYSTQVLKQESSPHNCTRSLCWQYYVFHFGWPHYNLLSWISGPIIHSVLDSIRNSCKFAVFSMQLVSSVNNERESWEVPSRCCPWCFLSEKKWISAKHLRHLLQVPLCEDHVQDFIPLCYSVNRHVPCIAQHCYTPSSQSHSCYGDAWTLWQTFRLDKNRKSGTLDTALWFA